ncbi:alpha/beta hydrolase family protein [Sphingobacterium sp. Mn56C]|uniref:alpha/beta hydrolase family protein n=1 Tax=Sphingobacterium sp. Mn56C TaxID=3395261 RepID=UPI003BC61F85
MKKQFCTILGCALALSHAVAQKKPLDHSVYDLWKNISFHDISKSGDYVFYTVSPQEGDGYSQLKNNQNKLLLNVDRGQNPKLSEEEKFLLALIAPYYKDTREAKIKKKKADEMPKDSLLIYDIDKNAPTKIAAVKNYKTATRLSNYVAYSQDLSLPQKADPVKAPDSLENGNKSKTSAATTKATKKDNVLILQALASGDTVQFWKADTYTFSNSEKYLVFNKKVEGKDSTNIQGLYLYDIPKQQLKKISNGKGVYKGFTFDDKDQQLVFLADKSPEKSLLPNYKVYYYKPGLDSAKVLVEQQTAEIPKDWFVSGNGNLRFNEKGDRLFLGLAPIPRVKDTTLVEFEHAKVDIWNWKDDYLMPQQLSNLRRDQTKSYDAVFDFNGHKLTPLVDQTFDQTFTTELANEDWILATSTFGNRVAYQWQAYQEQSIFLVSTKTGEKKRIKENWVGQAYLTPGATQVLLYSSVEGSWSAYSTSTGIETPLTTGLPVSFMDEENDMPTFASSYGVAAFADDNKGVYINDRYDIWYFSFDGKIKKNITQGYGRKNNIALRLVNLDRKDNPRNRSFKISGKASLLLSCLNGVTKENGFFALDLAKNIAPKQIIQDKFTFRNAKADAKGQWIVYTKENYQNSPDIFLSQHFAKEQRLTDINPQQADYNWGTAELVHWTTPNGYAAEGILYKPENFDPNKKYPIIAYFYERLSDGLYTYSAPAPTPSRLNIPFFVSNEYLVFAPDIRYQTGFPGKAAEEYINSGMEFLAKNAWVDATKMGIQGQSWGGYQVAHLITRTQMYAAAWAGAPVGNMTSAYGGIRWSTGMSRQFQYEKTQSRLGKTLWEGLDLYLENSPLFHLPNVTTPLAIMANDNDGAVPWYQGIELFTGLRRLQKPVWMLNYNGDDHNLLLRQNRKDIQIREKQFFDHFLKGMPAPVWIKDGVPAINKGIDWGLEY